VATVELLIPGEAATATGGYIYDRRIAAGLRELGWCVRVHALDATFPRPDERALAHADAVLGALADGAVTLIDGLALGAMPQIAERHRRRLCLVALVHHPLYAETGLAAEERAQLRRSETRALAAVRHVVTTSEETCAALDALEVAPGKISVVEPGTDPAPPAEPAAGPSDRGRISAGLRLLCVATLTPRKGHELLLEALAALPHHPWHLTCVGSLTRANATTEAVLKRISALGLRERVSLLGEVDEHRLARELRRAGLFVLPTRYEGYGMAVAQALRFGVPVIASQTGAIGRLLARGGGTLVPPGDTAALRRALEAVMSSAALLATMTAEARARAAELPDWGTAAARMAGVLETVRAGRAL